MAVNLNFHIQKFSHGTVIQPDAHVPWIHITSTDLVVLLDRDSSGRLDLQVLELGNILEYVNLGPHIDAAINAQRSARQSLLTPQLPIYGINKDKVIAVKYRPQEGKSRHLQMAFRTLNDCQQVLSVFQQRGMEIQTQRPSTACSQTSLSQSRPLAQSNSPYFEQTATKPQGRGFHLPPVEAGSLSQYPTSSRQPNAYHSMPEAPRSLAAPSNAQHGPRRRPHDADRGPLKAPGPLATPATAQVVSPLHAEQTSSPHTQQLLPQARPSSSPVKAIDRSRMQSYSSVAGASDITFSSSTMRASSTILPQHITYEPSPHQEPSLERPQSKSKKISRPSTGTLELPPLPKPKSKAAPRPNVGSLSVPTEQDFQPNLNSPLKSSITMSDDLAHAVTGGQRTVSPLEKPVFSPMEQLLARESASRVARVSSLIDAPHEIVSSPTASYHTARASTGGPSSRLNDYTVRPTVGASSHEQEAFGLATYASQSREDRTAALDEFMASMLEDPSFTVLCQDVENCWRRIALGL